MTVAFRVDGGRRLGMGHINRCLSVARYLNGEGIKCFFLISNPATIQTVSTYGKVIRTRYTSEQQDIMKFLSMEKDCKVLVIDSKRDSISRILGYAKKNVKIVLIDNTDHYRNCDLVILPGVKEQFKMHPKNALFGPRYILLNPSFKTIPSNKKRNGRILFSAGSTDKFDITKRVLCAFKESDEKFGMTVVLGKFYKHSEKIKHSFGGDPRFTILVDPQDFSKQLSLHSLGVITFGISVYEAAAAKLPVLVISHSNENDVSARNVEKYSWMKYIGKYDSIDYEKMVNTTLSLLKDEKTLKKMSEAGKVVDGRGPERVGKAIISLMKGCDPLQTT